MPPVSQHRVEPPQASGVPDRSFEYCVYGVTVCSDVPLELPVGGSTGLARIELRTAPADYFTEATKGAQLEQAGGSWYLFGRLADGSSYARWEGVGEFHVSADGAQVLCRPSSGATSESFEVYLLGQALSFALVKQGLEPLHATAVVVDGQAVVFLGASGFGKSTLAACFLEAGYTLLTDDVLILQATSAGVVGYPGPRRIKLLPEVTGRYLGDAARGVLMNPDTEKLILGLGQEQHSSAPVPIATVYALSPDWLGAEEHVRIRALSPAEAFFKLVKSTFNYRVADKGRLGRQFKENAALATQLRVRELAYPRSFDRLADVRDCILRDVREGGACD